MGRRWMRVAIACAVAAWVLAAAGSVYAASAGDASATASEASTAAAPGVSAASADDPPPAEPDIPTPPPVLRRLEDDDYRVAFRGTWRYVWDARSSGYSRRYTSTAGSYAYARFRGTGITLVAPLRADGGIARVTLDGVTVATVSLYSSTPATSAAVWSTTGLADGYHVVKVTCTGSREASSTGTFVSLDAFDVEGSPALASSATGSVVQHDDWRLYRRGSWVRRTSTGASAGSAMYSTARGASVKLQFKGTAVTWIGRKSVAHGLAEVWLDGRLVATVGGAPGPSAERRVMWAISGLRYGTHTVVIRNLGRRSGDTGTGTVADLDVFLMSGSPVFASRPTPFSYPWRTYIVVDKSDFRLYWVKNGILVKHYPIAHGKIGWTTPSRTWRIDAKYHTSPTSVYGPRKMRMFKQVGSSYVFSNYAIHGTDEPWVIGTRASHGCIRMYNSDVLELFPQVPLGTMVVTRD